ncbi:MAG: hypothetical protein HY508_14485 [Acidobacteria bacterium]|nr:hypothetical protein [Acidobacteriota bacterium]
MSRIQWQVSHFGFVAAIVVVPIAVFLSGLRRVRAGRAGKLKAFVTCWLAALSPTALYVAFFFALVGIEELSGAALIAEEIGRSFLIVVGFGLGVWLLVLISFAVLMARAPAAAPVNDPRGRDA